MTAPSFRSTFLPVEPLLRLAPRAAHDELGYERNGLRTVLTESQERKYHRARAAGRISLAAADEISTAFGYHPAEVWGSQWWAIG